ASDKPFGSESSHSTMPESRFRAVKAFKNETFLAGPDARILRIIAEYLEPQGRFQELRVKDTIVFFGSARIPSREVAAAELEVAKKGTGDLAAAQMRLKMSRFYEDTRELAHRLTLSASGL